MQKLNQLRLLSMFAAVFFTSLVLSGMSTAGEPASLTVDEQGQSKPKDPCWFMTLKDPTIPYEVIEKRQAREMYGYPSEVPLSEAIRIFNEETRCKAPYKGYPALTEDELIAAIVAGPDYGKQGQIWLAQKDALWRIASKRIMPKGSLLVVESGGRIQESPLRPEGTIQAKGIRITLMLGLDGDIHDIAKPEETLVIRKTYSQVEIVR